MRSLLLLIDSSNRICERITIPVYKQTRRDTFFFPWPDSNSVNINSKPYFSIVSIPHENTPKKSNIGIFDLERGRSRRRRRLRASGKDTDKCKLNKIEKYDM